MHSSVGGRRTSGVENGSSHICAQISGRIARSAAGRRRGRSRLHLCALIRLCASGGGGGGDWSQKGPSPATRRMGRTHALFTSMSPPISPTPRFQVRVEDLLPPPITLHCIPHPLVFRTRHGPTRTCGPKATRRSTCATSATATVSYVLLLSSPSGFIRVYTSHTQKHS